MSLPAGRLRHRITLLGLTVVRDNETGSTDETYAPVAENIPAEFTPLSVTEFVAAQAAQSQIAARVRIRPRAGLSAGMRLIHRGLTYNIEGPPLPDPDSGREYVTLAVSQVTTP